MSPREKRILILCDGTGQSEYNTSNPFTNVSRIKRYIKPQTVDGTHQVCFYVTGIGTDGVTQDRLHRAIAYGIEQRIKWAYSIICDNYVENDQIILIGFSRGAFIMRCVADLIGRIGVLTKRGIHYLNIVFDKWKACNGRTWPRTPPPSIAVTVGSSDSNTGRVAVADEATRSEDDVNLNSVDPDNMSQLEKNNIFERLLQHPSYLNRDVCINVCALWETVAAVGWPASVPEIVRPPAEFAFVDSRFRAEIENGFQALSLHEHRRPFLPMVWEIPGESRKARSQQLQQCWFVGYHSDIGGGRRSEGLAHISLAWIIAKLQAFIEFDVDYFCSPPPQNSSFEFSQELGDEIDRAGNTVGWRYRAPRRQFWRPNLQMIDVPDNKTMRSKETIHWTINVITRRNLFQRCDAMKPAAFIRDNTTNDSENDCKCGLRCYWFDDRYQRTTDRYQPTKGLHSLVI
ncbi:hypothetical protein EJ08DRAFT_658867 [Tothia fuscella]|uniref:T6SS Phospholipase effector Tle1-like catalytic domain-containing protein n=1 Tax=Tothia fuscella TaxID=1048955 RepID=A0A9P4U127_9PEZI|nr:hypothetical protein EJ08DRAFT_658867 [Tothia fuscella]